MIFDPESTTTPTTRRQALAFVGTWVSTLGVVTALLVINLVDLHPPQIWSSADTWNRWASRHEPDAVVAAMITPTALVLVGALAMVTAGAGAAVAVATRRGRTVSCSERWPTAVASFVAAVTLLAGGPAAASTGSGASAGDDVARRPVVELVDSGAATTSLTSTTSTTSTTTIAPTPSATRPTPSTTAVPTTAGGPAPPATEAPPRGTAEAKAGPVPTGAATVEVRRGDNLWRIAERQVAADPERGPTLRYWLRLIDTNQSRFVEPGNPSLILPGQVLDLPGD